MKVFLSYPSESYALADRIHLALAGAGHDVFFDRTALSGADDFNAVIRREISSCEIMIFLITEASIAKGSYTRTELRLARQMWGTPHGRVLPVMVEPVPIDRVPTFLRAVTIEQPEGDVPAEIAAVVDNLAAGGSPDRPASEGVVESALRAGFSATTLMACARIDQLLFERKPEMRDESWQSLRARLPSVRWTIRRLERIGASLGAPFDQPFPRLSDEVWQLVAGHQPESEEFDRDLEPVLKRVGAIINEFSERSARTRQAYLLGLHLASIEVSLMEGGVRLLPVGDLPDDPNDYGLRTRFEAWRIGRQIARHNRTSFRRAIDTNLSKAEDAGARLSIARGWASRLEPVAKRTMRLVLDKAFGRAPRGWASQQLLESIAALWRELEAEVDRLAIILGT